jgi:hypothetical protein
VKRDWLHRSELGVVVIYLFLAGGAVVLPILAWLFTLRAESIAVLAQFIRSIDFFFATPPAVINLTLLPVATATVVAFIGVDHAAVRTPEITQKGIRTDIHEATCYRVFSPFLVLLRPLPAGINRDFYWVRHRMLDDSWSVSYCERLAYAGGLRHHSVAQPGNLLRTEEAVALAVVAVETGSNEIRSAVQATSCPRVDVVDFQYHRGRFLPAVLTCEIVTLENAESQRSSHTHRLVNTS